jgi:tyrosine-protein kinase Etk/Wzc
MAETSIIPVYPKPIVVYAISAFIFLMIGIAYVIRKEMLNPNILFRADIVDLTGIPVVSELSQIKQHKNAFFSQPNDAVLIEQFRQLRTMLGLYSRSFSKKKILVTSSIPGEGKSFVSSHLAYSLAQSGRRVVLLDIDLRKGDISKQFGLDNHKGIVDYLFNKINWAEIINASNIIKNLSIIPSGTLIGDYSELLLNHRLESLFIELEREFDYIIIDTSPIFLVSDANLLSEFCDITLLVVRHDHTPKSLIKNLEHSSKVKSLKKTFIVFNGLKNRGIMKKGYGFGYGYEYGYEYHSVSKYHKKI